MASHLIDADGAREIEPQAALFGELAARRRDFFWLDLHGATKEQIRDLGEAFDFHPLSIEDAMSFGQRPKLGRTTATSSSSSSARYTTRTISSGCCFYSTDFLVTVRRDSNPAFAAAREASLAVGARHRPGARSTA